MFNFKREKITVTVAGASFDLYEPSALERTYYAKKLIEVSKEIESNPDLSEAEKGSILMEGNLKANHYLISCCLSYGMQNETIEAIQTEVSKLTPAIIKQLTDASYTLAGMVSADASEVEKEEYEKK